MSSSSGHVALTTETIEKYGADTVRFFLLNSAEPWQDFDWRADEVGTTHDQLARFHERGQDVIQAGSGERDLERIDRWLLSKLQATVRKTTDAMDDFQTRKASQEAFYHFEEHLTWYRKRADLDRAGARWTLSEVLRTRLRLLAPIVPFLANELHEQLTGEPVEDAAWPEPDPELESTRVEVEERLVEALADDVREVIDVTDTNPDRIAIYTAAPWKHRVYETVRETGPDVGAVMGKVMQKESLREKGDAVNDLAQDLVTDVRERDDDELAALDEVDETELYGVASGFIAREFDATVDVVSEEEADADRASRAVPFRPAIDLE
jgi:leucyl-tRNA synthetase